MGPGKHVARQRTHSAAPPHRPQRFFALPSRGTPPCQRGEGGWQGGFGCPRVWNGCPTRSVISQFATLPWARDVPPGQRLSPASQGLRRGGGRSGGLPGWIALRAYTHRPGRRGNQRPARMTPKCVGLPPHAHPMNECPLGRQTRFRAQGRQKAGKPLTAGFVASGLHAPPGRRSTACARPACSSRRKKLLPSILRQGNFRRLTTTKSRTAFLWERSVTSREGTMPICLSDQTRSIAIAESPDYDWQDSDRACFRRVAGGARRDGERSGVLVEHQPPGRGPPPACAFLRGDDRTGDAAVADERRRNRAARLSADGRQELPRTILQRERR